MHPSLFSGPKTSPSPQKETRARERSAPAAPICCLSPWICLFRALRANGLTQDAASASGFRLGASLAEAHPHRVSELLCFLRTSHAPLRGGTTAVPAPAADAHQGAGRAASAAPPPASAPSTVVPRACRASHKPPCRCLRALLRRPHGLPGDTAGREQLCVALLETQEVAWRAAGREGPRPLGIKLHLSGAPPLLRL